MEEKEQSTGRLHFVGKKDELIAAKRSFRTLEGRDILVVYHQGIFYALDSYCYHAGGMLQSGDIEEELTHSQCRPRCLDHYKHGCQQGHKEKQEFDGRLCIICPKHKYKISLAKGECLYKVTDPREKPPVSRWYSKGVKQRTHVVTETNGDVYVKLSLETKWIESDYYQGEKGKMERAKAEAAETKKPSE